MTFELVSNMKLARWIYTPPPRSPYYYNYQLHAANFFELFKSDFAVSGGPYCFLIPKANMPIRIITYLSMDYILTARLGYYSTSSDYRGCGDADTPLSKQICKTHDAFMAMLNDPEESEEINFILREARELYDPKKATQAAFEFIYEVLSLFSLMDSEFGRGKIYVTLPLPGNALALIDYVFVKYSWDRNLDIEWIEPSSFEPASETYGDNPIGKQMKTITTAFKKMAEENK